MKKCCSCKKIKSILEFYRSRNRMDGYHGECKLCAGIRLRQWRKINPNKIREINKRWRNNHPDEVKRRNVEYLSNFKNKLKAREKSRLYYRINKEQIAKKAKLYYKNNKEKICKTNLKYHATEGYKIKRRKWDKNCRERNKLRPEKRLNNNISRNMYTSLKGNKKGLHWESITGYALEDLMSHLEKLFKIGMTWKNYGRNGWHLDHVIPISLWEFNSYKDREFKQCWSLANLQPLWANENIIKRDKIIDKSNDK